MRLLFIITGNDPVGGALVHLVDIVEYCRKRGDDVLVLIGNNSKKSREHLEKYGVEYKVLKYLVREISPIMDLLSIFNAYREIVKFNPDLVLCHSTKAGIIGRIAAKMAKKKVVFTAHGWAFTEGVNGIKRIFYCWIERFMQVFSDRIIAVSKYDYELAIKNGFNRDKLILIYNGVEKKQPVIKSSEIDDILYDESIVKVIMVARFNPPKDHIQLIKAIKDLEEIHLIFVGDGELMEDCKSFCKILVVEGRVHFVGYQYDVAYFLSKSDIFCLISNYEGFPLTTIEAMSFGLPVVVSDVGGAGEAVVDGVNGFKIPKGDLTYLSEKLKFLAKNEFLRKEMGKNSYKIYENSFTKEVFCEKTYHLYLNVLTKKNQRCTKRLRKPFN